jgi:peroxidase
LTDRIFTVIDPTLPKSLLKQLQKVCPTQDSPTPLVLDRTSEFKFDTAYYRNLVRGFGVMTSDQTLYASASTRRFVVKNLKKSTFVHRFGRAMIAMQAIEPKLEKNEGEIRKRCQFVN